MGKVNQFRPLKDHGKKLYKVKQERFDKQLVGEGVCTALSMQWLQYMFYFDSTTMNAQAKLRDISTLQQKYEAIAIADGSEVALPQLANELGLVPGTPKSAPRNAPTNMWWAEQGYGSTFWKQALTFLEKVRPQQELDGRIGACLGFHLVLDSVANIRVEKIREAAQNNPALKWLRNWDNPGHAVAFVVEKERIFFCDANCGIYEIPWDNAMSFFLSLEICYTVFGSGADVKVPITLDPQLAMIMTVSGP